MPADRGRRAPDDPLRAARGCFNALVFMAVVFLLVFLLVWAAAR